MGLSDAPTRIDVMCLYATAIFFILCISGIVTYGVVKGILWLEERAERKRHPFIVPGE